MLRLPLEPSANAGKWIKNRLEGGSTMMKQLLVPILLFVWACPCSGTCATPTSFTSIRMDDRVDHVVVLLQRLSMTKDYGDYPDRWLLQRFVPLANVIRISGTLVQGCFKEACDGDLEFDVDVGSSPETQSELARFVTPVPKLIHVEMVKALDMITAFQPADGILPFRTWRRGCEPNCVTFQSPVEGPRPMRAFGGDCNNDWQKILRARRVTVTGALVIDISRQSAGTGELEVHPVESINISDVTEGSGCTDVPVCH